MSKVDQGKAKSVLSQAFLDNVAELSEDQAGELIVKAAQIIRGLDEERKNDEKLAAAKQIVKDLNAGYTSAIKHERAKIQFLLERIEEIQNGEVNPDSAAN